MRGAIHSLDPSLVVKVYSMESLINDSIAQPRFRTWLIGVFSIFALTLARLGIYGVIAYLVTQRYKEIGIRMALGATRANILQLILARTFKLTALGILVGLTAAFSSPSSSASSSSALPRTTPSPSSPSPCLILIALLPATSPPVAHPRRSRYFIALRIRPRRFSAQCCHQRNCRIVRVVSPAMIRSDYILRLIEQLGAVLRAFVSGTKVGEFQTEDTQAMIEESCRRALGLSYATIRAMPPEHLVELLRAGGATWMDRCFLAGILHEYDAETSRRSGDVARARESAERALFLYATLNADPGVAPDYEIQKKSERLMKLLGELEAPGSH